jgi:hypothetical protein
MLSHSLWYPFLRRARRTQTRAITAGMVALSSSFGHADAARAQTPSYRIAAPIEEYRSKSPADEIALARSAAPPSISASAEVLVLGDHGYETAVKGTNGFVCFVERSWAAGFDDPEFWNPKNRSPNCFNATAARTELPQLLERTKWVLSRASRQEMIERTRSAYANHTFVSPAAHPGACLVGRFAGAASACEAHADDVSDRAGVCPCTVYRSTGPPVHRPTVSISPLPERRSAWSIDDAVLAPQPP